MTGKELQALLDRMGLTQRTAAQLLGAGERTMNRACNSAGPVDLRLALALIFLYMHPGLRHALQDGRSLSAALLSQKLVKLPPE